RPLVFHMLFRSIWMRHVYDTSVTQRLDEERHGVTELEIALADDYAGVTCRLTDEEYSARGISFLVLTIISIEVPIGRTEQRGFDFNFRAKNGNACKRLVDLGRVASYRQEHVGQKTYRGKPDINVSDVQFIEEGQQARRGLIADVKCFLRKIARDKLLAFR